jgi:hypothetical protein
MKTLLLLLALTVTAAAQPRKHHKHYTPSPSGHSTESVHKSDSNCFDAGKGYLFVQYQTAHELAVIAVESVKLDEIMLSVGCPSPTCFEYGTEYIPHSVDWSVLPPQIFTFSSHDGEAMRCNQTKDGKASGCKLSGHTTLDDVANFIIQHYRQ